MMDNFKEEIVVKRNRGLNSLMYALSWVCIVLFGIVGMFNLQMMFSLRFSVGVVVGFIIGGGVAFLCWRYKDNFRTEYEYTFTNGDLDVSKVLGNSRRKYLTSLPMKNVESAGSVKDASFSRYIGMKDAKKHNWFLNREGNLHYFYFVKNNVKHIMIIEPSVEMMDMLKPYLNFGVWHGEEKITGANLAR